MARSIRARVVLGFVIWSLGILAAAHVVSFAILRGFDHMTHVAHVIAMFLTGLLLLVVGFMQVRGGLSTFQQLRARLAAVRGGQARKVDGEYPPEVQPLVTELNALIEHHDQLVRRAQAKAGDLAHGLKTPLAVLMHEAERAEADGQTEIGQTIAQQVDRMRRQVDSHLAQARAAGTGGALGARCAVADSAEALARTLQRLHAGRGLSLDMRVPSDHVVRVARQDLDEMLGNLLDNACKWARTRVSVTSTVEPSTVRIAVDDDGPGIEASQREQVLQRGVRADETAPGSGLGLAIVRDLVDLYGGAIALDRSPEGGLRAALTLPRNLNGG
jgi:signal transduction histidine kinase